MNSMPRKTLGYKLKPHDFKVALARADKLQGDVAKHLGYHPTWVSAVKKGFFKAGAGDAKKIASFLSCKVSDIFVIEKSSKRGN